MRHLCHDPKEGHTELSEVTVSRWLYLVVWQSGSGLSGAGTREVKLLSGRAIEPGEPAHSQGSAGVEREASSLRISAH